MSFVCRVSQMFLYFHMITKVVKLYMLRYSFFHSSSTASLTWLGLWWSWSLSWNTGHSTYPGRILGIHPGWYTSDAGQHACTRSHTFRVDNLPPMFLGRSEETLREKMQNTTQTVSQAQDQTRDLGAVRQQCCLLHHHATLLRY